MQEKSENNLKVRVYANRNEQLKSRDESILDIQVLRFESVQSFDNLRPTLAALDGRNQQAKSHFAGGLARKLVSYVSGGKRGGVTSRFQY